MTRILIALLIGVVSLSAHAPPLRAEGAELHAIGPSSGLPIPRFVSMRHKKGNVRRGPSLQYRVDWTLQHLKTPLMVLREYDTWRKVMTHDGIGGWMHVSQLSNMRTIIVLEDQLALRGRAEATAPVKALAEKGAILNLQVCREGWCRISHDRLRGWVPQDAIWGTDRDLVSE